MSGPECPSRSAIACRSRPMPLGMEVHNVELQFGRGGQMVRSAGSSATVVAKEGDYVTLRLPSGEMRLVFTPLQRDGRSGRQRRPHERLDWQGGALEMRSAGGLTFAWRRHEPARPSAPAAGEGKSSGGTPPGNPVGRADQGTQDPQAAQAVGQVHREATEIGERPVSRSIRRGPSSRRACTRRFSRRARRRTAG